ncbi:PAS domain-containing sensor histidine kinase [Ancylothrix sp. C2]|uniref:PAS domain-containing sensor histidine kinase n=1 Tax=Ancylothrix sp. D3o TaxID=2953691 RepID=UPI0021BB7044|nr:PAS domain-containing sensor histidine kinase [Ancylothrix sp. D3o]MCT7950921.1 PAS domain-containing sensor histidine kinase [Ancylothrix sp. D3o]
MLEQIRQKLETEQRFRALLENGTDLIVVLNTDWVCRYASPSLRRILGFELNEVLGKTLFELTHPEDLKIILPVFEKAKQTPRVRIPLPEYRIRHSTGEWCIFESVITNLLEHPAVKGFVLNCHEITERKQSEAALKKAKIAAEAASKAKSAFLANMSHELRTPLSVIIGYSDMLLEEAQASGNSDSVDDLAQIKTAGTHLLSLINDLLEISKLEAGQMKFYRETINISLLVNDIVKTIKPVLETNGNILKVELDCPTESITADPSKLRQILINLLTNASKFTQEGTILLKVEKIEKEDFNLKEKQNLNSLESPFFVFSVADTGIGIPAEHLPYLFEAFTQVDDSMTRLYSGIGLGLAICRRLSEIMHGTITVESQVGIGSKFSVYLPVNVPDFGPAISSEDLDDLE